MKREFKRGDVVVYIPHGKTGYEPCRGSVGIVLGEESTRVDSRARQHYKVLWLHNVGDSREVAYPADILLQYLGRIELPEEAQDAV